MTKFNIKVRLSSDYYQSYMFSEVVDNRDRGRYPAASDNGCDTSRAE